LSIFGTKTERGEIMSVSQELGKVQAELEASQTKLASAEEKIGTHEATIATHEATITGHEATIASQTKAIDGHAAALTTATAGLTGQVETLTTENKELAHTVGEQGKKLESPAYKMASITGEPLEEAGGGGEGAEGGSLTQQYAAIKDPAERAAFLEENKAALYKEGRS